MAEALTYEKVWELFQEVAAEQKETARVVREMSQEAERRSQEVERRSQEAAKEAERRMQEMAQEAERRSQEAAKEAERRSQEAERRSQEAECRSQEAERRYQELDKYMRRMSKNLGGLGNSLGELIETLIAARLWEKFAAFPYNFQRTYRRIPIYDETNQAITDVDILLSNTEWAMAVEVKRDPNINDIDRHIIRMERVRKYPPAEAKGKKLLGALAGGAVDADVRKYAYEAGFYLLELQGESVDLVPPPEGFTPKIW
jgi:vacuolar-type H+-ATPase subunit I/STV1